MLKLLVLFSILQLTLSYKDSKTVAQLSHSKDNGAISVKSGSQVTISVGEQNGFLYTANGKTDSPSRISLYGEYFNDSEQRFGYTHIFLIVDSGISYWEGQPNGNAAEVTAQNSYGEYFDFQVICPRGVDPARLYVGKFNNTAILVSGPSRNSR